MQGDKNFYSESQSVLTFTIIIIGGIIVILDSFQFKAMESGIKAMSVKQQVHTHNIANLDTPDYKMKTFSFKNAFESQMADRKSVV